MKKVLIKKKQGQVGLIKKDWNKLWHPMQCTNFYIPTSLWCVTHQHRMFSPTSSVTIPFMCLFSVGSLQLLLSCTSKWSRFQSFYLATLLAFFFQRNFFSTCLGSFYIKLLLPFVRVRVCVCVCDIICCQWSYRVRSWKKKGRDPLTPSHTSAPTRVPVLTNSKWA